MNADVVVVVDVDDDAVVAKLLIFIQSDFKPQNKLSYNLNDNLRVKTY